MEKVKFNTGAEAVYASAKLAESKGCDMTTTCLWVSIQKDKDGYYIEVDANDLKII